MHLNLLTSSIRSTFAVLLSCFFLAQLPPAQKQGAGGPPSGAAIKSTAIVVNMYAIVEGRHGRLIPDLSKNDFELTEDGAEKKIDYFSRETNAPLSVGILVDTSASQDRLLATEQSASKSFLGSVLRHDDQAFVMHFDVDVELLQDFTNAAEKLGRAIDTVKINQTGHSIVAEDAGVSRGGTRLYDAVYLASNELMKARYGRKVLVLVTDGEDQGSKIDLQGSVKAAEKANVIVYSIVVSDADLYALLDLKYHGDSSVRKLSRETGGRTIRVKSIQEIGSAFNQISQELHSQYLLGYSPTNVRHDGSFRRIHVKIRGREYMARTRTGYYDSKD
jgi:VWFA-related protein